MYSKGIKTKKWLLVLLSALLLVMPILSSCSQAQINKAEQQYDPNYTIGIIKTTESERSSYIEFYNEDLELVNAIWYPYGGLWTNSGAPQAQKGSMLYLIPRGLIGQHHDRKVISLDLKTGDVREYVVDQVAIASLAVDNKYIYASNNLNAVGHIGRVDIDTGEVRYSELGSVAGNLFIHRDELYASWHDLGDSGFSAMDDDTKSLSTLDRNLKLVDTIDITASGNGDLSCVSETVGDEFYAAFSNRVSPESDFFNFDIYTCSNLQDGFRFLGKAAHEILYLLPYKDKLITINSDATRNNNFIDVYDRNDGALLHSLPTNYVPQRAVIDGDAFYVQGFDCLVKYNIDGLTITEVKRIDIPRIGSPTDADFHYLSGIFLNK